MSYVDSWYQRMLGRTPSASERSYWENYSGPNKQQAFMNAVAQEMAAANTSQSTGNGLVSTAAGNAATRDQIAGMYQTYLGREADQAGVDYYANSGMSYQDIARAIVASEENQTRQQGNTGDRFDWALSDVPNSGGVTLRSNPDFQEFLTYDQINQATNGNADSFITATNRASADGIGPSNLPGTSGVAGGLTEDQLRAILDERFGTFDARFDEVYDRIGEIGAGNVNDVFGDNYRQGASFQDYDTASFGPALRITPDAPHRNMQQPDYGGTSLQQYQQNRRANISDAPLSTATTQATNLTRQLAQQPVTYGGTTIPNLERDNPMNPRNYTRGTTIAQTPQAPTRNDGTPSYAQGSSVPSYADVWREFDAMDRQRAQQDARRRRMMRGQ